MDKSGAVARLRGTGRVEDDYGSGAAFAFHFSAWDSPVAARLHLGTEMDSAVRARPLYAVNRLRWQVHALQRGAGARRYVVCYLTESHNDHPRDLGR